MQMRNAVILCIVILLALIAVAPAAAAPNPPQSADWSHLFPAGELCDFDVDFSQSGKYKETWLPGNRLLLTYPGLWIEVTNAADPSKSARLIATGPIHITLPEGGGEIGVSTGNGPFLVPGVGFILYTGHYTYVYENGTYTQSFIGHGRMQDICAMIE